MSDEQRTVINAVTFTVIQADGSTATLRFKAPALDRYIAELVVARAHLHPEHPPRYALGQQCDGIADPAYVTELDLASGGSILHVRHPGLGWLHFLFPKREAQRLATLLAAQVAVPDITAGPAN